MSSLKILTKAFIWLKQLFCEHQIEDEKPCVTSGRLVVTCGVCGKIIEYK